MKKDKQRENNRFNRWNKITNAFKRRWITYEEWRSMGIFTSFILPFLFITSLLGVALGIRDFMFVNTTVVVTILFVFVYTRKKVGKKERKQVPKWLSLLFEIVLILIGTFQLCDTVRYDYVVTQIQFQNEGYVTLDEVTREERNTREGKSIEWRILEYDRENLTIYQHMFDGSTYLSKVDATDRFNKN